MFNNGRYVLRFVKASILVKTCNLHKISCGTLKYLKYCYEHGEIQLSILLIMYVIFEVLAFSWLVCYRSWNWYLQWISYYTIIEYIYIINIIWSLRNLFLFTLIIYVNNLWITVLCLECKIYTRRSINLIPMIPIIMQKYFL